MQRLEVRCAVRLIYMSLGVKGLKKSSKFLITETLVKNGRAIRAKKVIMLGLSNNSSLRRLF